MELTNTLVISFLVAIILLLLFSKITVQYNTPEETSLTQRIVSKQKNNSIPKPTEIISSQPTEFNPNPFENLRKDEYMPDELKQQIKDLEDRFYYNDCGKN
jgi:hypothetical protein